MEVLQIYSVLDIVKALSEASGKEVKYKIVDRRTGDSKVKILVD